MTYIKLQLNEAEIITFVDGDFRLDVNVSPDENTIWLSVPKIAAIFQRTEKTIYKHINSIFASNELNQKRNSQKMRLPFSDKLVETYSFKVLLSVGYRVNSEI